MAYALSTLAGGRVSIVSSNPFTVFPPEVLEILLHDLFQRWWLRETEGDGAGAINGEGPVVHDALDAGVEGINDRTEFQSAFLSDFTDDGLGELRCDAMRGQTDGAVVAQSLGGASCNAMSDSMTVR